MVFAVFHLIAKWFAEAFDLVFLPACRAMEIGHTAVIWTLDDRPLSATRAIDLTTDPVFAQDAGFLGGTLEMCRQAGIE
jgi:hypothetical protein